MFPSLAPPGDGAVNVVEGFYLWYIKRPPCVHTSDALTVSLPSPPKNAPTSTTLHS